ncbi:hypothetical protein MKW94_010865 [Papaver nudicaule]|uniref:pectinesterase n=1 Tax=Papaver nudicaule TaxID=74823 RepID=A0AA41SPZ5_PAPNU|nr:hypothetical protein [Papaver nudicaule]
MKSYIISTTFIDIIFLIFHLNILLQHITPVFSAPLAPIPPDKASLQSWAALNLLSPEKRQADLDPALATAEKDVVTIKVRKDGSGQFKTLTEAVKSIPKGNTKRTIISIGPGIYKEKVTIEREQPFVTFFGDPKDMPTITFDVGSVLVYSKYFMAVNIIFENSSPMPKMGSMDGQAVSLTLFDDYAALYNCKFKGFQDTLCDLHGNHFFKDCYIQGMADFIFGNGKSIYLNTEIKALWDAGGVINRFAFVHCSISGVSNGKTYLGRLWKPYGKTVFLYADMSSVIHPEGWSDNGNKTVDSTLYNAEYMCTGPGANLGSRVKFAKKLTDAEAKPYLDLNYINAAKWLLPPPQVK